MPRYLSPYYLVFLQSPFTLSVFLFTHRPSAFYLFFFVLLSVYLPFIPYYYVSLHHLPIGVQLYWNFSFHIHMSYYLALCLLSNTHFYLPLPELTSPSSVCLTRMAFPLHSSIILSTSFSLCPSCYPVYLYFYPCCQSHLFLYFLGAGNTFFAFTSSFISSTFSLYQTYLFSSLPSLQAHFPESPSSLSSFPPSV